jgi:hypothetical protein
MRERDSMLMMTAPSVHGFVILADPSNQKFRRIRICEKLNFTCLQEEEEVVQRFFEVDEFDSLIITHFLNKNCFTPPNELLVNDQKKLIFRSPAKKQQQQIIITPSTAGGDEVSTMDLFADSVDEYDGDKETEEKEGEGKSGTGGNDNVKQSPIIRQLNFENEIYVQNSANSLSSLLQASPGLLPFSPTRRVNQQAVRNDSQKTIEESEMENDMDFITVDSDTGGAANSVYVDQGGEVLSTQFHLTNRLIHRVFLHSLDKNYFGERSGPVTNRLSDPLNNNNSTERKRSRNLSTDSNKQKNGVKGTSHVHLGAKPRRRSSRKSPSPRSSDTVVKNSSEVVARGDKKVFKHPLSSSESFSLYK